ncbi:MAG TPA: 50S ribosomal protein L32, partial [Dehalococcoidia bacterium]|nr:50S ribosomal protein L32 [Dehalococcoidia bacterium]
ARARQGERRSHLHRVSLSLSPCSQCHTPKLPHHACPTCGYYNGRQAVKIKGKGKKE